MVEYKDYVEWVDAIVAQLQRHDGQGMTLFDRYALYASHPDHPIPEHILFDIEDVEEEYLPRDDAGNGAAQQMLFDDRCWDVIDGEFACTRNGKEVRARVYFDSEKRRFEIISPELEAMFPQRGASDGYRRNLVSYLNATQSFRIVTDKGLMYAHGQFYKSRLPLYGRRVSNRIELRQILLVREELAHVRTEKGKKVHPEGTGWEKGSIFEYIDRAGKEGLFASDRKSVV